MEAGRTHHIGCAAAIATEADRAWCSFAKTPKQVGPLPVCDASRQPGCAVKAARTSPMAGHKRRPVAWRSLPCRRISLSKSSKETNGSGNAGAGAVRSRSRAPSAPKTSAVDSGTPGLASKTQKSGRGGRSVTCSPMPHIKDGHCLRHTVTSAPSLWAIACRSILVASPGMLRTSARRTAAASADPPPSPAATGRFFVNRMLPSLMPGTASVTSRQAFVIKFSPSIPAANGPSMWNAGGASGLTVIVSPMSAKATRLTRSW